MKKKKKKASVFFFTSVKTFENKKQNSPSQVQPSLESKPRQHRDVEGFCFPNTAVFVSPLDARGQAQLKEVSAPPSLSGREIPTGSSQALGKNQSHSIIRRKGLLNPAPLLAQRKGWKSSRTGPGHIQSLQVPPAQLPLPKVQSAVAKTTQPGNTGDPQGVHSCPQTTTAPDPPGSLIPALGTEVLAENNGNSPQGLIQTHLPLFPPSTASPPLPSPRAALPHQTPSLQTVKPQPKQLLAPGPNCLIPLQLQSRGTRTASFLSFCTVLSTVLARAEQKLLDLLTPGRHHR